MVYGLQSNTGVFETMRTYGREIFRLEDHLARLEKSAEVVGMRLPGPIPEIEVPNFPSRIRLTATPDKYEVEFSPIEIDEAIYDGVEVIFAEAERENPEAKALPYDLSHDAHDKAVQEGFYEAVFVDRDGFITEGAYSNIFWVKEGEVFTREDGVLKGITRDEVMKIIPVSFKKVSVEEFLNADEKFLTKTSTGVVPIGKPGPICEKLKRHFADLEEIPY